MYFYEVFFSWSSENIEEFNVWERIARSYFFVNFLSMPVDKKG